MAGHRPLARAAMLAGALTAILASCAWVDADQARICRLTLPALEPAGAAIRPGRSAAGPVARSVRIDYVATLPGRPPRGRFALCRFAEAGLGTHRSELVGIRTPEGDLPGARIYLLQRYYLDTQDALVADPGPDAADATLPEIPPALAYLAQQLLSGLPLCAIYALLAAAYALVFGLVGRINLAFGEIAAIGATAAGIGVAVLVAGGLTATIPGLAFGVLLAVGAGAVHAGLTGHVAFAWVPPRAGQASLIATVGLSLALSEYLRLAGGAVPLWIPSLGVPPLRIAAAGDFVVTLAVPGLLAAMLGLGAAAALAVFMRVGSFGRAWRAQRDDPRAAALFGVDPGRILTTSLMIAGALAGLAGGLVAVLYGAMGFAGGFAFGMKSLAAALLGRLGSVGGALLGGLAIGLVETLWSAYLPIAGRDIALYALLALAIVIRPETSTACRTPQDGL